MRKLQVESQDYVLERYKSGLYGCGLEHALKDYGLIE